MEIEHFFTCPYCWQEISFVLDLSVAQQNYIEDCEVCRSSDSDFLRGRGF